MDCVIASKKLHKQKNRIKPESNSRANHSSEINNPAASAFADFNVVVVNSNTLAKSSLIIRDAYVRIGLRLDFI